MAKSKTKDTEIQADKIEVRVPNRQLTAWEAEEYLIRSNKNSGEWDWERLANEWEVKDLFNFRQCE
ncbi:MAG: hypothetical protein EBT45_07735 [Alphaproteobacteria bacterium]|nr:hypothetical protein [Alphaproteobacteria bacterium]